MWCILFCLDDELLLYEVGATSEVVNEMFGMVLMLSAVDYIHGTLVSMISWWKSIDMKQLSRISAMTFALAAARVVYIHQQQGMWRGYCTSYQCKTVAK